jgi:hypothetical protein
VLNKSILDFSAVGNTQCDFAAPNKISRFHQLILAAHPYTVGSSD